MSKILLILGGILAVATAAAIWLTLSLMINGMPYSEWVLLQKERQELYRKKSGCPK